MLVIYLNYTMMHGLTNLKYLVDMNFVRILVLAFNRIPRSVTLNQ